MYGLSPNLLKRTAENGFSYNNLIPLLIILIIYYLPYILFLLSVQKNLSLISYKNRKINSYLVWIGLIPLIGLIWNFFLAVYIKESNYEEFKEKKIDYNGDYGYSSGITFSVLSCCIIIPCINFLSIIPQLVFFILFWIKITELNKLLILSDNKSDENV